MQKILTVDDILNSCLDDFDPINKLESYSFEEKKQFLKSLQIVKEQFKELQEQIIKNNLDQSVLNEDRHIKTKDKLKLLKNTLRHILVK